MKWFVFRFRFCASFCNKFSIFFGNPSFSVLRITNLIETLSLICYLTFRFIKGKYCDRNKKWDTNWHICFEKLWVDLYHFLDKVCLSVWMFICLSVFQHDLSNSWTVSAEICYVCFFWLSHEIIRCWKIWLKNVCVCLYVV